MMTDLLIELGKQAGIVGTVLALSLTYVWKLHQDLKKVQDLRVADAKAMVDKLLGLNDKWNDTLRALVEKDTEANKILEEVRDKLDDLYVEAEKK